MALVDYGSDSDDEVAPSPLPPAPVAAPRPLPPKAKPKGKAILNLPPPSSGAKATGSSSGGPDGEDEGPARKKPRFDQLRAGVGGSGKSGLAALLPAPKNPTAPKTGLAASLPPPKAKVNGAGSAASALNGAADVESTAVPEPAAPPAPSVDFFGLGAVSAGPSSSRTTPSTSLSAAPVISSAPSTATSSASPSISISSAPVVADEQPPPPSLLDPYPGYWQRSDGSWVARDASTDPTWAAFYEEHYAPLQKNAEAGGAEVPREFRDLPGHEGMQEYDAAEAARKAREAMPEIIDPREEAMQAAQAEAEAKPQVRPRPSPLTAPLTAGFLSGGAEGHLAGGKGPTPAPFSAQRGPAQSGRPGGTHREGQAESEERRSTLWCEPLAGMYSL